MQMKANKVNIIDRNFEVPCPLWNAQAWNLDKHFNLIVYSHYCAGIGQNSIIVMDNRPHYSSKGNLSVEKKTWNLTKAVLEHISISPKIVSVASQTRMPQSH